MDALSISDQAAPSVPLSWVKNLFQRMQSCYGKHFLDMWTNTDMESVMGMWAQQMATMTHDELRRGVAALMTRDWPPTLPEFVKMCKPSIDPETAYYEALEQGRARDEAKPNVWSSPAIYWAWRAVGPHEFRSQSYPALKARWAKALADEVGKGQWAAIPETVLQVGVDMGKTAMSALGAVELSKAIANVGKTPQSGIDHLRWAREIRQRVARGDRSVALIAAQMAEDALGAGSRVYH